MESNWKLYAMGVRGSWPVHGAAFDEFGGATSCYILKRGEHAVVIDCGSGLCGAGELLRDCKRIDVLLTHIHYDHLLGLLAWKVFPKGVKLRIYAQFSKWFGVETINQFFREPFWPYSPEGEEIVEVDSPGSVDLSDGVRAIFYPSNHPNDASLIRVDTPDGSVAAAIDYEHSGPFPAEIAKDCDIMLYDAMYTAEEYLLHVGWGHSCWEEGCRIAREHGVKRLFFTHHDPVKTDEMLLAVEREAQHSCPDVSFMRQGTVLDLNTKGGTSL